MLTSRILYRVLHRSRAPKAPRRTEDCQGSQTPLVTLVLLLLACLGPYQFSSPPAADPRPFDRSRGLERREEEECASCHRDQEDVVRCWSGRRSFYLRDWKPSFVQSLGADE